MDNKKVGLLIIGIAVIITMIIYLFNSALHNIVNLSCSAVGHGDSCPMYNTIKTQTNLSLSIVSLILILGIFLILSKPEEKIVIKKLKDKKQSKKFNLSDLRLEDKRAFKIIQENKTMFQGDLIEKLGFGKAKVSRILDRLENKNLIERKRRGMTNVVILRN